MTRDEAVEVVSLAMNCGPPGDSNERFVRALVNLGLLKVDEPKSLGQKITDSLSGPFELSTAFQIERVLDRAGLQIVEKAK